MECFRSVFNMTFRNFEVILIDNGSTDGSGQAVLDTFQNVRVVHLDRNMGYGKAVNQGIVASEGIYIGVLDNDTVVDPSWLSELVRVIDGDANNGIVGSKVYFHSTDRIIYSAGGILDQRNGLTRVLGLGSQDSGKFDQLREVDWVDGCAILIKRAVIEKAGYFDEGYGFYREDIDLCQKAHMLGYRTLYVPTSIVWHKGSTTSTKLGLKFYYLHRSWIRYVIIHSRRRYVLLGVLFASLLTLGESIAHVLRGNRGAIQQAIGALAWNFVFLPVTLAYRRKVRRLGKGRK